MIIVSKIPLGHLDLLHEMRYVFAMKCSSGDKNQVDQCGRSYGFGAHTLGLYMVSLLFSPSLILLLLLSGTNSIVAPLLSLDKAVQNS